MIPDDTEWLKRENVRMLEYFAAEMGAKGQKKSATKEEAAGPSAPATNKLYTRPMPAFSYKAGG